MTRPDARQIVWRDAASRAEAHTVADMLVIRVAGRCDYARLIDLACYVARQWGPRFTEVVLDFSNLRSADPEGVRFLIGRLHGMGSGIVGNLFLIRAPVEARSFLKQLWGAAGIHFAINVAHARTKAEQLRLTSRILAGRLSGLAEFR